MKNRSFLWSLWIWAMAFVLSFGSIGGLVTGFDFTNVSLYALALWCAGISLVWVCIFEFSMGRLIKWIALEVLVLTALILWFLKINPFVEIANSWEVLLHQISDRYSLGYGWGTIQWSETLPATTMLWALGLLAMPASLATVWAINRKKSTFWAILPPLIPFFACLVVTDTVPATGYLLLLAVGVFQLVLTGGLRRREEFQGKRLVAISLIPVLLAACLLFWAVPQEGYQPMYSGYFDFLQDWIQGEPVGGDQIPGGVGNPERLNLSELGDRNLSQRTVMRVIATVPGTLYLRAQSYDSYDGLQWLTSEYSSGIDTGWGTEGRWETVTVETVYAVKHYFLPGNPGPEILEMPYEMGKIPNERNKREYSFQWQIEGSGGVLSEDMRRQCLDLPEDTRAQAYALVQEMLNGKTDYNSREIALIIADNVATSAQYSLEPSKMPQEATDFAVWFLTEGEKGYCVHFATAATVLLRAAGIPARYVAGYVTEVADTHTTRVYQKQSHAWVEYFDEEKGWTILDPTPSYEEPEPTEPTQSTWTPSEGNTEEPTLPPTETVTRPTQGPQNSTRPTEKPTETPPAEKMDFRPLLWLLGLVILTSGIWGQYRIRLGYSHRRMTRGNANQQALARWRAVLRRGRILGRRPPQELKRLAEKAKFSQHMLTAEELACFDQYLLEQSQRLGEKPLVSRWLLRLFWAIE